MQTIPYDRQGSHYKTDWLGFEMINVFFIPSFVVLPLSPPIGGVEVGKVIAVFSMYDVFIHTITIDHMQN